MGRDPGRVKPERAEANSEAHILSRFPGIPSGPVALFTLIFSRSLRTPALLTLILGMGCFGIGSTLSLEWESGVENYFTKECVEYVGLVAGVLDQAVA